MPMQASIAFLCQIIADSYYCRYQSDGTPEVQSAHAQTFSLLPIVTRSSAMSDGGTLWVLPEYRDNLSIRFHEACQSGVRVIVCEESDKVIFESIPMDVRRAVEVVVVPNTHTALFEAASAWRGQCMLPIVGITGSVGKTTTKHMLGSIFAQDAIPVLLSRDDSHSLEGLALDMLHITSKHIAAIFELGTDVPGEMEKKVSLLQPTMGAITSVSAAHLHGLGSVNEAAREKRQIFTNFTPSQIGIICGDYPLLTSTAYQHPVVRFGLKYKNMVTAKKVEAFTRPDGSLATRCLLRVYDHEQQIVLPGHHLGIVYAALAAATICYFLHTPFEVIVAGLQAFMPLEGRFALRALRDGRGTVVDDALDANPESVKAALHAVHTMQSKKKIAVLGDMQNLGTKQYFWHRHVGRELIKSRSISRLVLVGQYARAIGPVAPATMDVSYADDWQHAHEYLTTMMAPQDNLVLVKGARELGLRRLVDKLAA